MDENDVFEHRLNQMEIKMDAALAGIQKVLALEIHHAQTRKDVDAAHELLRAYQQTVILLSQQANRLEVALQPLHRLELMLTDSDTGIVVRLTRVEEQQEADHDELVWVKRSSIGALMTALLGLVAWAWGKLFP